MKRLCILALAEWLMAVTPSFSAELQRIDSTEPNTAASQVIVQIFGRMCEYHREDVEAALRAFKTVRQVEFLNDHGTVMVSYQPGGGTPEQLAEAVHRALTGGWNCSARVDRGEQ